MLSEDFLKDAAPGIMVGVVSRWGEVVSCLISDCDSLTLKVEKVLTAWVFIGGFTSPSLLIWRILKSLLTNLSTRIAAWMNNNPVPEGTIRMLISSLEQYGTARIWDGVRDAALCMRFNNCRNNDFLMQLNNIKIKVCDVQCPWDNKMRPSLCEKLFNEIPLILLAVAMLILFLLTNSNGGDPKSTDQEKTDSEEIVVQDTREKSQTRRVRNPLVLRNPVVTTPDDNGNPPDDNSKPKPEQPTSDKATTDKKEQVIHAKCPKCEKSHYCRVPRPWLLSCSQSFPSSQYGGGARSKRSEGDRAAQRILEEALKEVKCKYCQDILKKALKRIIHQRKQKAKKKKKDTQKPKTK